MFRPFFVCYQYMLKNGKCLKIVIFCGAYYFPEAKTRYIKWQGRPGRRNREKAASEGVVDTNDCDRKSG